MEKMTNKIALNFVLGLDQVKENVEVFEKLQKMLEQVEKKNSSAKTGKPTKAQEENETIKKTIMEVMARVGKALQIKELMVEEELTGYSNQKLSALLKQLVETGKVERIEVKKVAMFGLVK